MQGFRDYIIENMHSGRISEIYDLAEEYFNCPPAYLNPEIKLQILCTVMNITPNDLDTIITEHSEVNRTIKGHAFEVAFDTMMLYNDINCEEVGGDTDVDRVINGSSLQLKTPYMAGCNFDEGIVSYKTHKTHGAKSQRESVDYYHKVSDFADYLVGLVTYEPFQVIVVPKEELPRVKRYRAYIESPLFIKYSSMDKINNFEQLGIEKQLSFPKDLLNLEDNECLPISSKTLQLKSDFILRAIFIKDNFRIWDMNIRGFIREHVLNNVLLEYGIRTYPVSITRLERSDKCDLVLKSRRNNFVRFQVKGLTWRGCRLNGKDTVIDCETQLSRGHVNDHPTQSRLYQTTDFDYLIIAIEPPYINTLSLHTFGEYNYNWQFYCIPTSDLRRHHLYTNRIASHQYISFEQLENYIIDHNWINNWEQEL